ncbi:hypothetical protein AUP68_10260 [Ilyonectria robusta]
MAPKVLRRQSPAGAGLRKAAIAIESPEALVAPITSPPSDLAALREEGQAVTFASFTAEDAFELGHQLFARLAPLAPEKSALISICLANSGQVVFQCMTGSGITPDNEHWVRRKRNTGDEAAFAAKFAISDEKKGEYAIHGGAVPIYVQGVEGVVAVVIVSGLAQSEDHGVIFDVIKENWQ